MATSARLVAWFDDDGSFGAALVVATCLGIGIASLIGTGLLA